MRPRRRLLAGLLAAPLGLLGICGSIASLAPLPAVCEAPPANSCCPRSESPVCPRSPEPGRCVACGAAAFLGSESRQASHLARDAGFAVAARPGTAPRLTRSAAALSLSFLAASPPRHLLLATFRN